MRKSPLKLEPDTEYRCEYCGKIKPGKEMVQRKCHRRWSDAEGPQYVRSDYYTVCALPKHECGGYLQMSFEG